MTLGALVAVMRDGQIEQVAPPLELYTAPVNTFVARFIGVPPMNILAGPIPELGVEAGVSAGVRPHDLAIAADGAIAATVEVVEARGYDAIVHLRTRLGGGAALVAVVPHPLAPGSEVRLDVAAGRLHRFDAQGRRIER